MDTVPEPIVDKEVMSDLPAWMRGVDKESLKKEVEEEIQNIPSATESINPSSYGDIPDWLKTASVPSVQTVEKSPNDSGNTSEITYSREDETPPKRKNSTTSKKTPKKSATEKEGTANPKQIKKEDTVSPRPKKQKPTPVISE